MKKQLAKNTTASQCAAFVASIGCPRHLEICQDFGRKLSRRRYVFRTEEAAAQRRSERAKASGWVFAAP